METGYLGSSENKDWHLLSRSVLKDFNDDALPISAGNLFQNGAVRMLFCWWNLHTWPRTPLWVGWAKVGSMGSSRRPWVILDVDIRSPWVSRYATENSWSCWRADCSVVPYKLNEAYALVYHAVRMLFQLNWLGVLTSQKHEEIIIL